MPGLACCCFTHGQPCGIFGRKENPAFENYSMEAVAGEMRLTIFSREDMMIVR